MGNTHLLKHAAHAKHKGEYAPLNNQIGGCRRIKDANPVLRIGQNAMANLRSRTNVVVVRTINTDVIHKHKAHRYAPQKKDFRGKRNATGVLRSRKSALAYLRSRTHVVVVSTGDANVIHKSPIKTQKKDCRRIKNATTVLRIRGSALVNLLSRTNVVIASTGDSNVMHKQNRFKGASPAGVGGGAIAKNHVRNA